MNVGETGLQVLAEGLHEYATTDAGVLDLTLLRSVGWLARVDHPLRPHKIGPEIPTPGAQCLGRASFRMGIRPFVAESGDGHLYRAAEEFSVPLQAHARWDRQVPDTNAATVPLGLEIGPADVVLSAVKNAEEGDGMVVRFFNSSDGPVTATLRPAFAIQTAHLLDLEERELSEIMPDLGRHAEPAVASRRDRDHAV